MLIYCIISSSILDFDLMHLDFFVCFLDKAFELISFTTSRACPNQYLFECSQLIYTNLVKKFQAPTRKNTISAQKTYKQSVMMSDSIML